MAAHNQDVGDGTIFGTCSVEGLIAALERCDKTARVTFDFCGVVPSCIASYRGHYDHLALGWAVDAPTPPVSEIVQLLRGAIGKRFDGWKGGTYLMGPATPVWVDRPGQCTSTAIVAVERQQAEGEDIYVTLVTRSVP